MDIDSLLLFDKGIQIGGDSVEILHAVRFLIIHAAIEGFGKRFILRQHRLDMLGITHRAHMPQENDYRGNDQQHFPESHFAFRLVVAHLLAFPPRI
jgi:hypothetical protein